MLMKNIKKINDLTRKAYNIIAEKYYELFDNEMNEKEFDRNLLDQYSSIFQIIH